MFTHSGKRSNGLSGLLIASSGSNRRGENCSVSGSTTGNIESGSACALPSVSYTMGNGSPQ